MATASRLGIVLMAGLLMACADGERVLTAHLTGSGSATAEVRIEPERGKICWELSDFAGSFGGVTTGMHIHAGAGGEVGPVVVEFVSGSSACTEAEASAVTTSTLWDLVDRPQDFYVDLHTTRYPDGAARGQLRAGAS
jgi:CHRD domain